MVFKFNSILNRFRDLVYFEKFSNLNSPIHKVNPLVKFVLVLSIIVLNMSLIHIISYLLLILPLIGIILISRISLKYYFFRSLFFITLFAVIIAIPLLFFTPGDPLASWTIGSFNVVITTQGALIASSFVLRIWISILAILTLIFTTPFANLIHAMKHVRVPRTILILFSLTYRYIFLFIDELIQMLRAKESRTFRKFGFRFRFRTLGQVFGTLLIRSIDKSERVYWAMLARGYNGDLVTKEYKTNYIFTFFYILFTLTTLIVIYLIDIQIIPFSLPI
ncbi:MAG: cobalt ECF transporter T component CbiQ [Candidatus Helarchaeota archaeon]